MTLHYTVYFLMKDADQTSCVRVEYLSLVCLFLDSVPLKAGHGNLSSPSGVGPQSLELSPKVSLEIKKDSWSSHETQRGVMTPSQVILYQIRKEKQEQTELTGVPLHLKTNYNTLNLTFSYQILKKKKKTISFRFWHLYI